MSDMDDTVSTLSETDPAFLDWLRQSDKNRDPNRTFIMHSTVANLNYMRQALGNGADVNTRHPDTGATALHYAAITRAREVLNWLAKCDGIDYLIRDNKGRLPSALAYEVADDPAIGRFLAKKQNEQARERGVDIRTLLVPS